jgi:hypothetical protein
MGNTKNGGVIRRGFIIGLALSALSSLFGFFLALVYGSEGLVFFVASGMAVATMLCAIAFRIASKQSRKGTHAASEMKS